MAINFPRFKLLDIRCLLTNSNDTVTHFQKPILKIKATYSFEIAATTEKTTRCHTPVGISRKSPPFGKDK